MKFSLGISNFLEEITGLSHSIVFLYLYWSLRKAFLSLLAILWNSAIKRVCLSFSPLLLASLLTAICRPLQTAILHFFFLGMVLFPISCTMSQTSVHSSSSTLSIRSSPLNLFITSTVCAGKGQFSFQSQRKAMRKMFKLPYNCSHLTR